MNTPRGGISEGGADRKEEERGIAEVFQEVIFKCRVKSESQTYKVANKKSVTQGIINYKSKVKVSLWPGSSEELSDMCLLFSLVDCTLKITLAHCKECYGIGLLLLKELPDDETVKSMLYNLASFTKQ
jgi:hypothetical protein